MRPTLYEDDLPLFTGISALGALRRVLPLRCPGADEQGCACSDSDGKPRGWLYPDQPDWWYEDSPFDGSLDPDENGWHQHCHDVWRHMGILEEDS